jgi:hypothetical protein
MPSRRGIAGAYTTNAQGAAEARRQEAALRPSIYDRAAKFQNLRNWLKNR